MMASAFINPAIQRRDRCLNRIDQKLADEIRGTIKAHQILQSSEQPTDKKHENLIEQYEKCANQFTNHIFAINERIKQLQIKNKQPIEEKQIPHPEHSLVAPFAAALLFCVSLYLYPKQTLAMAVPSAAIMSIFRHQREQEQRVTAHLASDPNKEISALETLLFHLRLFVSGCTQKAEEYKRRKFELRYYTSDRTAGC